MTCRRMSMVCRMLALVLLPLLSKALVSTAPPLPGTKNQPPPLLVSEWNPNPFDEEEPCVIPPEEATVDHILHESAMARALEITTIVASKLAVPLCASVVSQGWPVDWNEFWSRRTNHHDDNNDILSNAECLTRTLEELGPVYVKLGQTLASRPDAIPVSLANALSKLQDCMQPFEAASAQRIVTNELLESQKVTNRQDVQNLLECLTEDPIAAASVGQVYKAHLQDYGDVALKVQRPGIKMVMERDAALLRTLATWVESIPAPAFLRKHKNHLGTDNRLIASELEDAVEGFFARIYEELDYRNELANGVKFASLYSHRGGTTEKAHVIVPKFYSDLCTENVLVMEWLEGTRLTGVDDDKDPSKMAENLSVIKQAIDCTLSQLFETGVLHGDPHGGNLLKIQTPNGPQLGYLDFGLLSSVPQPVRDALVCAVVHLVLDHDSEAVAMLFGDLELVPSKVIEDPLERKALTQALNHTMNAVLVYPDESIPGTVQFPELEFDTLIYELTKLVPRFQFQLPPYFLQKARALGCLEGMARSLDSDFNVLQMLYPYALNRLLVNPSQSPILEDTVQSLLRSSKTGHVELEQIVHLLDDSAHLTGYRKRKVVMDTLRTSGGRRLARSIVREKIKEASTRLRSRWSRRTKPS